MLPTTDEQTVQLKVHGARIVDHGDACPIGGTVLDTDGKWLVACGSGVLELTEIQLEGRKRMTAGDFLRGHPVAVGTVLKSYLGMG
jgi:methionyl-tRNA formyltransferase